MKVLSLFDGISCGQVALQRAGIEVEQYFASEIEQNAMQVTQRNHPNTIQLGDITKIKSEDLPQIDLIMGGSPCQGFSRAGKQLNFSDSRSSLFFEFIRLLKECKPKYFLLENVKMKGEWIDLITKTLKEIYPDTEVHNINSRLVSAQLRNRFYWTNIPNVKQPEDRGITLQSILESGFTDKNKARCLLESDSRPLKSPAKMLNRCIRIGFTTLVYENEELLLKVKNATKLGYIFVKDNQGVDLSFPTSRTRRGRLMADKLHTITKTPNEYFLFKDGELRYFTRRELERCQTLPDDYTIGLTRNQAAGVIGNGWTVDVIAHIFSTLNLNNKNNIQ